MDNNKILIKFYEKISQFIKNPENRTQISRDILILVEKLKKYKEPQIAKDLLHYLKEITTIESFSLLEAIFSEEEFTPTESLVENITKSILAPYPSTYDWIRDNVNMYKQVFIYVWGLYCCILNNFFSKNLKEKIQKLSEFFKVYSILLRALPERMDMNLEMDLEKGYIDPETEMGWSDFHEDSVNYYLQVMDRVFQYDIQVKIIKNSLKFILDEDWEKELKEIYELEDDKYEGWEEEWQEAHEAINLIKNFNKKPPKFLLNKERILQTKAWEKRWFIKLLQQFYEKEESKPILKVLEQKKDELKKKEEEEELRKAKKEAKKLKPIKEKYKQFKNINLPSSEVRALQELETLTGCELKFQESLSIQYGGANDEYTTIYHGFTVENNRVTGIDISGTAFSNESEKLTFIPESLGDLTNLKYLFLQNNNIEQIPDTFGNLEQLKILNLSSNKVRSFPESFGNLASLEFLNLRENGLEVLPECIGQLSNLKNLQLVMNNLKTLPESIGNLQNLEILRLEMNPLEKIPSSLSNLERLKKLKLVGHKLDMIPKEFYELNSLEYLVFEYHDWKGQLPKGNIKRLEILENLPNLKVLVWENHEIEEIIGVEHLQNLKELDLSYNSISEIKGFEQLMKLKKLNLSVNHIKDTQPFGNLPNVEILNLYSNKIIEINFKKPLLKLEQLGLGGNKIKEITGLENCPNLKELDLSNNEISEFKNLEQVKDLERLYINRNKIEDLRGIGILSNLRSLRVDDNLKEQIKKILGTNSFWNRPDEVEELIKHLNKLR